jgi:hypothetical protein
MSSSLCITTHRSTLELYIQSQSIYKTEDRQESSDKSALSHTVFVMRFVYTISALFHLIFFAPRLTYGRKCVFLSNILQPLFLSCYRYSCFWCWCCWWWLRSKSFQLRLSNIFFLSFKLVIIIHGSVVKI